MAKTQLKDPQPCIAIEEELDRYADRTREWQISRSRHVKNYGNKFDFNDYNAYPYSDEDERRIFEKINSYLGSLDSEERKLANGRLLFHYKDYLSQPFAKHAVELIANSVNGFQLNDDDKVQFLEYLFKADKQDLFHPRILYKLANYNPNDNLEATNRLYNKTLAYFDGAARKNDKKIDVIFGMYKVFAQNVEGISADAVVNYAKIYFDLADRTSRPLNAAILKNFVTKTPKALKRAEECKDATVVDKEVVKAVFKSYAEHVNSHSNYNPVLARQMEILAQNIMESYQYNLQEALDLAETLRPAKIDESGKKIRDSQKRTTMNDLADRLNLFARRDSFRQMNPIRNVDRDNPSANLTNENVVDYAEFLFSKAKEYKDYDFKTAGLYGLLTCSGNIDKKLLLDVADAYGKTYTAEDIDNSNFNEGFHNKFTNMLAHIVTKYDYSYEEIKELTHHIAKGGEGKYSVSISENDYDEYGVTAAYSEKRGHDVFRHMAQAIENAHSPINDRDDIHPIKTTPKKEINPIVLQKTSSGKSDK